MRRCAEVECVWGGVNRERMEGVRRGEVAGWGEDIAIDCSLHLHLTENFGHRRINRHTTHNFAKNPIYASSPTEPC